MDTVKSIRMINVSQSLIYVDVTWNEGDGLEQFSLQHSRMLLFDCAKFGIPYSSLIKIEIHNGAETTYHEFSYSSRSEKKGEIVVQPQPVAFAEEDDYGQMHPIRHLSISNDLCERVKVQFRWNSGKKEFMLHNTGMMNIDCEEIPQNERVDVEILHPAKKVHMWFMHTPAPEAAQLTLTDRGSGMLVYTQYRVA
jgi:hypothetical protein